MGKLTTFVMAACMGVGLFCLLPARDQETTPTRAANPTIRLAPDRLKAYEGYFQFSRSKDQVIQFHLNEPKGDTLVAKLLWNGLSLHIVPESDSVFHNVEPVEGRTIPIKFIRNKEGAYVQMYLFDQNAPWNRIKEYHPLVRKEIAHTPEQLRQFEGLYQGQNKALSIRLTEKDNELVLKQLWGGNDTRFIPDSPLHFFNREQLLFTLQFIKGDDGSIATMIAFGRDRWEKAKKLSLTPADMKAFEGKYRLKEDPDDIIQMTVSGGLNLTIKQLWDGKEIVVKPLADFFFYNEDQGYTLTINKDDTGAVTGAFILISDYFEKIKN